ncbi:MAG: hypothetical protein Q6353_022995 [Candidatus Sigynarchaeum springense]
MSRKNWESIEGVIDVGPVVIAHCNNPAKASAVAFLQKVLVGKVRALLPVTAFLGAYHILTRYLKVTRHDAVLALEKTLAVDSPAFYETITREEAKNALTISSINKLESWDGYVINIAREFDTRILYSIDKKLEKDDFKVIIPIPEAELKLYHEWVKELVK